MDLISVDRNAGGGVYHSAETSVGTGVDKHPQSVQFGKSAGAAMQGGIFQGQESTIRLVRPVPAGQHDD